MDEDASGRTIYGVDFSGAEDAGRSIWITRGVPVEEGLRVEACHPAEDLPYGGRDRGDALYGLHMLVMKAGSSAFGFDFPFSLPRALVPDDTWRDWLLAFPDRYRDAEAFRDACKGATKGEVKRRTEEETRAPMAAYNHRLYRQTYHGLNDLLAPLVKGGRVSVLPMDPPQPGIPWFLEVCPASTLVGWGLDAPYKGRSADHRDHRERILQHLEDERGVELPKDLREAAARDRAGDAVDSLLAAEATARHVRRGPRGVEAYDTVTQVEGHIYA